MIEASIFSGTIHSFRYNYYYLFTTCVAFSNKEKGKVGCCLCAKQSVPGNVNYASQGPISLF